MVQLRSASSGSFLSLAPSLTPSAFHMATEMKAANQSTVVPNQFHPLSSIYRLYGRVRTGVKSIEGSKCVCVRESGSSTPHGHHDQVYDRWPAEETLAPSRQPDPKTSLLRGPQAAYQSKVIFRCSSCRSILCQHRNGYASRNEDEQDLENMCNRFAFLHVTRVDAHRSLLVPLGGLVEWSLARRRRRQRQLGGSYEGASAGRLCSKQKPRV